MNFSRHHCAATVLATILLCVATDATADAVPPKPNPVRGEFAHDTAGVRWAGRDTIACKASSLTAGAEPAMSPDGRRVAFVRNGTSLWLCDLRSSKVTLLRRCGNAHSPTWDPKGQRIAFTGNPGSWDAAGENFLPPEKVGSLDSYGVWIIDVDSGRLHKLPGGSSEDQYPVWSPDGHWIAWTRGKQLWLTDTTGVEQHALTAVPPSKFEFALSWSPDGTELLYAASENLVSSEYELRLIRRDGTDQRSDPTSIRSYFPQGVTWSPDGKFLLMSEQSAGIAFTEHGAGGRARTLLLVPGSPSVGRMAISRDQKVIVYDNGDPEGDELLSMIRLH